MTRLHSVLLLSVLAGCTETIQLTRDPLESLVALEVSPMDKTLTIKDLTPPNEPYRFMATGRFSDGSTRDITQLVEWKIDNGLLGYFKTTDPGVFTPSHGAAGRGTVTIEAQGLVANAALTVIIDATVIDQSFPPPMQGLFGDDAHPIPVISGDPNAPRLIYPADATVFPQSIAQTLFQFERGATTDVYRLLFESDVLTLAIETGADRWQANGQLQRLLAATGIAGPIRLEVQARSSTGPEIILGGNRITMEFTADAPGSQLLYWSAATNGIMRGGVEKPTAGKLYPVSTTCVGCHAVSPNGDQLAMGFDNTSSIDLQTIDTTSLSPRITASATRPMGWATYNPDGSKVLVANNGTLTLYDTSSGNSLGNVPLPAMRYATHPDWSPDGNYVAIALSSQTPANRDVRAASIARIPYNNGAWGTPEVLVPGASTNNNYFPKWSPDGSHIAYVHATAASQGATSAELMLVAGGGGTPRPLRLASHRVGVLDDVPNLSNTMPAWWRPKETELVGPRAWLAFVSARPYGAVLPTGGRGQIWITSLDLTSTGDPSSAAFWLPCQEVTVLNNNPVWSTIDTPTL